MTEGLITELLNSKNESNEISEEIKKNSKNANSIEYHIKNIREGIEKMNDLNASYKLIERTIPDPTCKMKIKVPTIQAIIINCTRCNKTCQYPSSIPNDCDLHSCPVMRDVPKIFLLLELASLKVPFIFFLIFSDFESISQFLNIAIFGNLYSIHLPLFLS